jgi:hypothetical protein
VKMSANCDVVTTWRTRDRWQPSLGRNEDQSSHTSCADAERVGGEVHDADVVTVDESAAR